MLHLRQALAFLKSIWGALAGAAVLFPGAIALLGLPIAPENSEIALWYPVLGSIFAAFGLLLLLAYGDRLTDLSWARRIAVRSIVVAAFCIFALLGLRHFLIDVKRKHTYYDEALKISVIESRDKGVISRWEIPDSSVRPPTPFGAQETQVQLPDPWDIVALAFFVATMTSLAVGFGALGLHSYVSEMTESRDAAG